MTRFLERLATARLARITTVAAIVLSALISAFLAFPDTYVARVDGVAEPFPYDSRVRTPPLGGTPGYLVRLNSPASGLRQVDLQAASSGVARGRVVVEVLDPVTRREITKAHIDLVDVSENASLPFRFPITAQGAGDSLLLHIYTTGTSSDSEVRLWGLSCPCVPSASIVSRPLKSDETAGLALATYTFAPSAPDKARLVVHRLYSRPNGSPPRPVFLGVALIAVTALVGCLLLCVAWVTEGLSVRACWQIGAGAVLLGAIVPIFVYTHAPLFNWAT